MALNLGTLNTVFTATTRDFDAKTKRVNESLERTESRASRAGESLQRLNNAFNRHSRTLTEVGDNLRSLSDKLRVAAFLIGTIGAAVVTLTDEFLALSAAAAGALVNVQLEPLRDRLRSTGATASEVTAQVDRFANVADEAGLNLFSIADGAGDFTAAFQAAGNSVNRATEVVAGFATSASAMGQSGQEVNKMLEDLAEATREGDLTIEKLRESVSFTNDPLQTLSEALGYSERQLEAMAEAGVRLNDSALVQLSRFLRETSGDTDTLSNSFNRLITSAEELFARFNESNIPALKQALQSLQNVAESDQALEFMKGMAEQAVTLITDTIPNLAQSFVKNFDTITNVVKGTLGFLIGSSMGGVVGGALGALIGASGRTQEVLGTLSRAFELLGPAIREIAGPAVDFLIDKFNDFLDILEKTGKGLGIIFGQRAVGPASIEGKLKAASTELEAARERVNRLASEMADLDDSQITDGMRKALDENIQQYLTLQKQVEGLREARKLAHQAGSGGSPDTSGGDGGSRSSTSINRDPLSGLSPRDRGFIMSLMDESVLEKQANVEVRASPANDETSKMLFPNRGENEIESPPERFLRQLSRGAGAREVPDHLREIISKFDVTINQAQKLQDTAAGIGDAFGQAFERAVMGTQDFSEALDSMARDIAQTILRENVTKPLKNMVSNYATSLIGNAVAGSGSNTSGVGAATSSGFRGMAKGGVVNEPAIMGEAGPEAAVPLPDGRSIPVDLRTSSSGGGGDSGPQVVINDQRSAEAPEIEQSTSTGPDGRRQLELTVRDTVSRQITRGEHDKALRDRFGAQPRTRKR